MAKVLKWICDFMAVVGALLLLFITFSIAYSIITRKLNLPTPIWVVQFNEYALLWVTFLATAWILSKDKHVSVQILVLFLGKRGRRTLAFIQSLVGIGLCGVLCWYGMYTTWDHYARGVIDVGSVDIPKAYVLAVIPLGFLLLVLQFIAKAAAIWLGKEEGEEEGRETPENRESGVQG